ncbi:hypothetical protein [Spirilliplanes yamanashiensis]|uniref:Uncharacterized protein n=1 Tax=Spirilliplanes yamanashiensis TaxID=42233 RepID=A0A8J4DL47_9ACTN|nr:hypothetical protein [Spirilliplanes yamanashiensis]MDP9818182.1 hypothetical protein [Spirilliplanes yamanashiensis]GIJ04993.1 hypothetical protein Sya03_43450 [Spirilliplanes yamanashiensis]
MAAPGSSAADVVASGEALRALRREAAAVDRLRREWIAQHAGVGDPAGVELAVEDLVTLKKKAGELPRRMGPDAVNVPAAWADVADRYGAFVAVADPVRNWDKPQTPALETTDGIVMRRPRPVRVGVYQRSEGEDGAEVWELRADAVTLDVVDDYSYYDVISLDGRWWHDRKVQLTMYPDQSIKTWAVTSSSMAGAIATSVGTLVDAAGAAQLSATHERAAELAELEQRVKLAELYRNA